MRAAGIAIVCACLAAAQNSGSIEGVVVDSATGVPIAGVSVYFGSDKAPSYEAETNASGQFRFTGMANGDYGSHFQKSGYVSQFSGSVNSALKPVHIAGGPEPVRLTVPLARYGKLRGRVLDAEGKPVAGAKVTLAPLEETTDDQGQFSFSQITPGSYRLKAAPGTAGGATAAAEEPAAGQRTALLPTWYPSGVQADLAEPVLVRGGDDLSGYDIRLQSLPVYRVRGKAFNADGTPIYAGTISSSSEAERTTAVSSGLIGGKPGAGDVFGYFSLQRALLPSGAGGQDGMIRDGSFELASVPRGLRQISVTAMRMEPDKAPDAFGPLAATVVSVVVDHDIDDLEIRSALPIAIEGSVELFNTPADQIPEPVRNAPVSINVGALMIGPRRTGNRFRTEGVMPGEVLVAVQPGLAGGYYLKPELQLVRAGRKTPCVSISAGESYAHHRNRHHPDAVCLGLVCSARPSAGPHVHVGLGHHGAHRQSQKRTHQ